MNSPRGMDLGPESCPKLEIEKRQFLPNRVEWGVFLDR